MTDMRVFSLDYEGDQGERARRCMSKAREALEKWQDVVGPLTKGSTEYRDAAADLHRGIKAASVARAITGEAAARDLENVLRDLRAEMFGGDQ